MKSHQFRFSLADSFKESSFRGFSRRISFFRRHFNLVSLVLFFLLSTNIVVGNDLKSVSKDTILMGVSFTFTAVHNEETKAQKAIENSIKEVIRIELLISSWDKNSQTSNINKNAGIKPVQVEKELFELIRRSKKISKLTEGCFDVSFASLDKIWNFNDSKLKELPSEEEMAESISKIGFEKIILNEEKQTVFLKEKGMKIGFGAIGKGYAANRVKAVMLEGGIESGVVNAGGDLLGWGTKPSGASWNIGVADPTNKKNIISWLDITDMAVVTSGNYEKFIEIDGKKYCHIINPKTGFPVAKLTSVTIICPDAELADALATSVFVLGKEKGLSLINKLNGIECIIIDDSNEILVSDNLNKNYLIK